jgi:hypothetical protein
VFLHPLKKNIFVRTKVHETGMFGRNPPQFQAKRASKQATETHLRLRLIGALPGFSLKPFANGARMTFADVDNQPLPKIPCPAPRNLKTTLIGQDRVGVPNVNATMTRAKS